MSDNVNKPAHYQGSDLECKDAIRGMLGREGWKSYCQGQVLRYLWRYAKKGKPVEDLEKANTYRSWLEEEMRPKEKVASLPEIKAAILALKEENVALNEQNLELIKRVETNGKS